MICDNCSKKALIVKEHKCSRCPRQCGYKEERFCDFCSIVLNECSVCGRKSVNKNQTEVVHSFYGSKAGCRSCGH